jgi:hypothetical protein
MRTFTLIRGGGIKADSRGLKKNQILRGFSPKHFKNISF